MSLNRRRIDFAGPEGANPLGFLTSLGTLRVLTMIEPDAAWRLGWGVESGSWRPFLDSTQSGIETRELCASLAEWLAEPPQLPLMDEECLGDNLTIAPSRYRDLARHFYQSAMEGAMEGQIALAFLAAFGSDAAHQPYSKDRTLMQDTALRTMSGAGHQHFIRFMRDIIANTNVGHLYSTLFERWAYRDDGRGMNLRWDPLDDRRYAMRWKNPSSDAAVSMRGANRLAIEALPLFSTAPQGMHLATTGFRRRGGTYWYWPLWTSALELEVIRSTLQIAAVSDFSDPASQAELKQRGIATIYRTERITVGKFRNFTPPVAVGTYGEDRGSAG